MDIRELRKMTGMSQARFGEKYGIPKRTIEDWETEKRTAPEYVIEMLTKVVKMEEVNMKAWMFSEYRDSRGTGSQKLFKKEHEAVEYARDLWASLNEADRKTYREDPCGEFLVAEVPVEWDEIDEDWIAITADGYDPVWDALAVTYVIRDREAGNEIEYANTIEEAERIVEEYEETDRREGTYTEDFYEIAER